MQTYNQIIKLNREFATNHYVIKHFGNGQAYNIPLHDQQDWLTYPTMWLEDLPLPLNQNELTFSFRAYFIGQVAEVKDQDSDLMSTNENDVKSDMIQCALDLLSFWAQDSTYPDLDLVKSGSIQPIEDKFSDRVTGCYVDLKLKQAFRYNKCAIPMSGVTPPPSETCQPVTFTLNDVGITATPSGLLKTIVVQTDADTPVQVGTVLTDTATSLIVSVPDSYSSQFVLNIPIVSEMITADLVPGDLVRTGGYYVFNDGGAGEYEIMSSYSFVDDYGLAITLDNGNIAVLSSNIKRAEHFGVFPDGVTDWETSESGRYTAIKNAALIYKIHWNKGLYKTAMNVNNLYSGMKMDFNESEFGGVIHLLSGSEILDQDLVFSMVNSGPDIIITTSSVHNMVDNRLVFFQETGTGLDTGDYLSTIIDTTSFSIVSAVDVSGYVSGAFVSDSPLKDVTFSGSLKTYDRVGTINLQNFKFDTLIVGSDASKHVSASKGRGVHFYTNCKDIYGDLIICEDTGNQDEVTSLEAGIAIDGTGQENINITALHVKDCGVGGVVIQSNGFNCENITVDAYGRGVITRTPISATTPDINGLDMATVCCGISFIRSKATVGSIQVKNKNARGEKYTYTDRPNIYADVLIDRSYIDWNLGFVSFEETRSAQTIGSILCENVLNMAVAGSNSFNNSIINSIDIPYISPDNPLLIDTVHRANYGLIFHSMGQMKINKLTSEDIGLAPAWRSIYSTDSTSFFSISDVYIDVHTSTIGICGNRYHIEDVYVDDRDDGDDSYAFILEDNSNRSDSSLVRNIKIYNRNGYDSKAIDFASDYSTLENVWIFGYGSPSAAAIRFSGRMSNVSNLYMQGNSIAGSDGFDYNSPYRGRCESLEITIFTGTGVTATGASSNLIATNCISTGNGVGSSLPVTSLVNDNQTGWGNFAWTA